MYSGIRLHDTAPGTLEERLGFAKAQGFTCAHLALSKTVQGFSMNDAPSRLTDAMAGEVHDIFVRQGMQCAVLGCYLGLAQKDPTERARIGEIYKAHLRVAPKMGALVVGTETHATDESVYSEPVWESEEAFEDFMTALTPVVRAAEEYGAILAVEPVHCHIISTPLRAQRMLERLPSDHLRIILDTVNLISPETVRAGKADALIDEAIARLGDKIMVLHMKDYIVEEGKPRVTSLACGMGEMHYEALLRFGLSHDLPMTLEDTKPDNAENARKYLAEIANRL